MHITFRKLYAPALALRKKLPAAVRQSVNPPIRPSVVSPKTKPSKNETEIKKKGCTLRRSTADETNAIVAAPYGEADFTGCGWGLGAGRRALRPPGSRGPAVWARPLCSCGGCRGGDTASTTDARWMDSRRRGRGQRVGAELPAGRGPRGTGGISAHRWPDTAGATPPLPQMRAGRKAEAGAWVGRGTKVARRPCVGGKTEAEGTRGHG